ncbi:MAG: hypothetical protein ACWGO1_07450, partial [Anaerolineales bacterium]
MKAHRLLLLAAAALLAAGGLALLFLTARASLSQTSPAQTHPIEQQAEQPAVPPAVTNTWQVSCADCPRQFTESTDRMLRLDSQGRPHLAYGRDHLYYAWYDGSGWHSEAVDASFRVGIFASLALDATDLPHISYYDEHNGDLKYAFKDAAGWHIHSLTDAGAGATSLGVNSSGYAQISYWYASSLHYAFQDASGWHFEQADAALNTGQRSSLALDSSGDPHISYLDKANSAPKYARCSWGVWNIQTVDIQDSAGEYSSIALDAEGHAHISYSYYKGGIPPNRDLRYAHWDGNQWIKETVDTAEAGGQFNSIALDEAGIPHISHYDGAHLRYAYKAGSDWITTTLDSNGNVGAYSSIAVDSDGWAHIGYYQSVDFNFGQNIRYIRQNVSGWQSQLVDNGSSTGAYTSLDLDERGFAHISYQDVTYEDLKYAYQDVNGWHVQTLDWAGEVGGCTSLALDPGEDPHIGYHDFDNKKLKYTYRDSSGWHTSVVDASSNVGCQASLALDSNGYPQFSYFDTNTKDLKYARWDGSSWSALGGGANDEVRALAARDGTLYAGGYFSVAGGVSARGVAQWDGSSWSSLGTGVGSMPSFYCVDGLAVSGD